VYKFHAHEISRHQTPTLTARPEIIKPFVDRTVSCP